MKRLFKKTKYPVLDSQQALAGVPLLNPHVSFTQNDQGQITLLIKRSYRGGLWQRFRKVEVQKPVVLDEMGSYVFQQIDGQQSVQAIIERFQSHYQVDRRVALMSTGNFLKALVQRGVISMAVQTLLLLLIWGWASLSLAAATWYPAPGWRDAPHPLAAPEAEVGGEIAIYAGEYPKSFNYYLDQNVFSAELFGAMFESLLTRHPLSLDLEPGLAEAWAVADDGKTFTFRLDPRARWSDGQPVTARDVQWTFDAVLRPANLTGAHKIALSRFSPPSLLDERTIRFTAHEVHWQNLDALAGLIILPQHIFAEQDFNRINFDFPVVSGLYRLGTVKEGRYVCLERRADWWQREAQRSRGVGNFQTLKFKFFAERDNAFEAFKKGELDLFPVYTAHLWATQAAGDKFAKHWIIKQKIHNYQPIGFQGFAMNSRRAPFDDLRVRRALALLLDRPRLNRELMHGQYFLHRSYFEDLYSSAHPPPPPPTPFDPDQARQLLAQAGWHANPRSGWLEKEGRPLRFHFLSRESTTDKFLVIYQQALKAVGIEMLIDKKDWAAWAKDMDEFNFDMTWAAWSAGTRKDPEPMWLSSEAERRSGQNLSGLKNPEIDQLIIRQRSLFDIQARHAICRQIDALLLEQVPYVLLWNIDYTRLLYWNKFGMPATLLGKYGDERAAYWLWWLDADTAAELEDAQRANLPLPARPDTIRFDEVWQEP